MSDTNIKEIVVAAIDFGTTFSGYAYSWREEYLQDPLKIYANRWEGETLLQAPTVVLFNSDETESYFGFEAENKYAELIEEDEHKKLALFPKVQNGSS
ncbi:HS12A-like protein [Mya arenaria]|uniref:HS12A-like protein n=1 Tax=Mya arenaria TaxID=6604 RepID=A0ABY7EZN8_MYAAR|nr:HS12A-like protein [Mya arenaria]